MRGLSGRFVRGIAAALACAGAACSVTVVATREAAAFVWPNVPEEIARALESPDVSERRLAAQRVVELPPEIAVALVQKAIADPDIEVRLRIAQAAIAVRAPKAGDAVVGWLSEGDARLRLAACDVIRASPTDRAVVALGRVLGDPDAHVRLAAATAIGSAGLADGVSPLLGHLDDPSPEVREEVARALGRIGDARAVVPLIGKVQDTVSEVRRVVARALGDLGDVRAASSLMLALQDASVEVRIEAVTALGKIGSDEATLAIAPLVDAPDDPAQLGLSRAGSAGVGPAEVRIAALRALGKISSARAVKILIAALAKDDPAEPRSPVREALVAAGEGGVKGLVAALGASPSPSTAAGAALVLGALARDRVARGAEPVKDGLDVIVRGMQRGVIPLRYGLRALAGLGDGAALPTVLELLDDPDPAVRREAMRAGAALLDPTREDGRAVDPASVALADAATPTDEKVELVRLLGRTGAPRAQAILLSLTGTKAPGLRLAVLDSLGSLRAGSADVDKALLGALEDESSDVRLHAATALAKVGRAQAVGGLLDRLGVAAEQDRGALGIAISGALSRVTDPAVAARVVASLATAPEVARDALIEGLGRMPGAAASDALGKLAADGIDDRRKVAEALGNHPESEAKLGALAADPDATVRANAAWSLGAAGSKASVSLLTRLLRDPDIAVAGDAAAALGRLATREKDPSIAARSLCAALVDARPYVRANALQGIAASGATCEPAALRDLVVRDPSAVVRRAAADAVRATSSRSSDAAVASEAKRALARCAAEDHDASVAARCASAPAEAGRTREDITVYVVPDGGTTPLARAPYALVRTDGFLRLGIADRRGELFELGVPRGTIRLAVPAALAR